VEKSDKKHGREVFSQQFSEIIEDLTGDKLGCDDAIALQEYLSNIYKYWNGKQDIDRFKSDVIKEYKELPISTEGLRSILMGKTFKEYNLLKKEGKDTQSFVKARIDAINEVNSGAPIASGMSDISKIFVDLGQISEELKNALIIAQAAEGILRLSEVAKGEGEFNDPLYASIREGLKNEDASAFCDISNGDVNGRK